jgi:hypothetical protein
VRVHRYTNDSAAGLLPLAAALSFDSVPLALQARFPTLLQTVCVAWTTRFSAFSYGPLSDLLAAFSLFLSVCLKSFITIEEVFHSEVDNPTLTWFRSPGLFMKFSVFANGFID